jgi:multicomponent Na+:H+ antiporter subunit E
MTITIVRRIALFAVVWWGMSEGVITSFWLAALSVAVATLVSLTLARPSGHPLRWGVVVRSLPFFASRSFAGGVGVMRRALHPGLPIAPEYVRISLMLEPGTPRSLFMCLVNLFPGTISVAISGDELTLHVIERTRRVDDDLRELEARVAAMFPAADSPPAA